MKNPWITYGLTRIGLYFGFLALLLLIGFDGIFSAVIAGVLALAVSLVFLQKQRDRLSTDIYSRFRRDDLAGVPDNDADHENQLLDLNKDGEEPKA